MLCKFSGRGNRGSRAIALACWATSVEAGKKIMGKSEGVKLCFK